MCVCVCVCVCFTHCAVGGEFLGDAFALGSLIQNKVAEAISGLSLNTGASSSDQDDQPMSMGSHVSAPRTLDALFAERARERADKVSPGAQDDGLSDGDCASWCSEDSAGSSVQLMDGTDAMVRYLRKGIGALECPVCSQLLTKPVTPIKAHGGCACSFCQECIGKMLAVNVVNGICRCPKCFLEVPTDVGDYNQNHEIQRTIEEFQKQGGEAAEYANMMTELTKSQEQQRQAYPSLSMAEFTLDPKPLATGAYGQVFKGVWEKQGVAIALKKIFIASNSMTQQQTRDAFRKEVEILKSQFLT
jgi:hypothetical protein